MFWFFYQIGDPKNLSNLPSNFFVNNLLATMALTDDQTSKKIVCDNCDSGDVAKTRCEECGVFLCHFCTESHKRYRATQHHKLTSMEELKASAGPASVAEKLRCAKHKEELVKLYCNTCQATICRDCTIVDHQGHKYGFIEDVALGEKQKIQTNLNEVKQRKVRVQQGITSLKRFDEDLVAKKKSVVAGINQHFDELSKVMEAKRGELIQKATTLTSSKQKQIQAQREQLEMALASCESSIEFTEQAFKNGNDVQVLSMQKYILRSLEDLKRVKDQTQPCVTEDMTFAISMSVKDIGNKLFNAYAVDDVVASPGNCKASFNNPDAALEIGKQSTITMICYDKYNKRVKHGGQVIKTTISGVEVGDVTVNDNNDGSHTASFAPRKGGVMKFEVTINGHPAPSCSLTKDVKWGFSNALGNGEITNNGLTMKGQNGLTCWRVGECSFVSGVHTWKVRIDLRDVDYKYHDYDEGSVEVGVIEHKGRKRVSSIPYPDMHRTLNVSLTLDMEKRSLNISFNNSDCYGKGFYGEEARNQSSPNYKIIGKQVTPYFSISSSRFTLSIVE